MGVEFEQLTEAQKEAVVLEINSRLKPWAENVSAASLLMVGWRCGRARRRPSR